MRSGPRFLKGRWEIREHRHSMFQSFSEPTWGKDDPPTSPGPDPRPGSKLPLPTSREGWRDLSHIHNQITKTFIHFTVILRSLVLYGNLEGNPRPHQLSPTCLSIPMSVVVPFDLSRDYGWFVPRRFHTSKSCGSQGDE